MIQQVAFSSRVGDRWSFAVEFEGIGNPPKAWNEWWGSLWLWVNGQVVGRPFEIEMVMTGFDSLVESAQESETRTNSLLSSLPADQALDLVMWARYGDDSSPPEYLVGNPLLLPRHEVLPRWTGPFFDGWEAVLIQEGLQERFIFRQKGSQVSEAHWPVGTFKSLVLEARDKFEKLATAGTGGGGMLWGSSPYSM
jgi:hypothetical protein